MNTSFAICNFDKFGYIQLFVLFCYLQQQIVLYTSNILTVLIYEKNFMYNDQFDDICPHTMTNFATNFALICNDKNYAIYNGKNFATYNDKTNAIYHGKNFAIYNGNNFATYNDKNFAVYNGKNFAI